MNSPRHFAASRVIGIDGARRAGEVDHVGIEVLVRHSHQRHIERIRVVGGTHRRFAAVVVGQRHQFGERENPGAGEPHLLRLDFTGGGRLLQQKGVRCDPARRNRVGIGGSAAVPEGFQPHPPGIHASPGETRRSAGPPARSGARWPRRKSALPSKLQQLPGAGSASKVMPSSSCRGSSRVGYGVCAAIPAVFGTPPHFRRR